MKKFILALSLVTFASSDCPAVNYGRQDGVINCPSSENFYCKSFINPINVASNEDTDDTDEELIQPRYCFAQHLYDEEKNKYYSRCCYMRYQYSGNTHNACVGLTDDDMMDVVQYEKNLEDEFKYTFGAEMKIYDIYCDSSLVYISTIAIFLLGLLL